MERCTIQKLHDAYTMADFVELNKLWDNDAPKTLVKFFPAKYTERGTNYFLESINTTSLWLSSPRFFNDPFDGLINYDYTSDIQSIIEPLIQPTLEQYIPKKIINDEK